MAPDARPALTGSRAEGGFTLLEVLTAFVVFALTLAALLQVFSSGLRDAQLADEYARAVMMAQSRMDEATATESLEEGRIGGEDLPFRWGVQISPYDEREESPEARDGPELLLRVRLLRIDSEVVWQAADGRERKVRLATLQVVSKP